MPGVVTTNRYKVMHIGHKNPNFKYKLHGEGGVGRGGIGVEVRYWVVDELLLKHRGCSRRWYVVG